MSLKDDALVIGGIALAVVGIAWWLKNKAVQATPYINPASDKNIVNQGVSAVGAALTGDSSFSLGGWLYDATHQADDDKINAMLAGSSTATQTGGASGDW